MFKEASILYFDPFYFRNGNTAKPKYFVVLKTIGESSIIASLPTRKDSIPADNASQNGCVEIPEINLNCFVISKHQIVTDCGKQFDFNTHLYGHQLDDYDSQTMIEIYPNEGSDYSIWGQMRAELFNALLHCFKESKSVKRKYRKLLE